MKNCLKTNNTRDAWQELQSIIGLSKKTELGCLCDIGNPVSIENELNQFYSCFDKYKFDNQVSAQCSTLSEMGKLKNC